MAHEEWRDVVGYEGLYQVSNLGRVRSLDRYIGHNLGGRRLWRGKVLKPHKMPNGYLNIQLSKDGKKTQTGIHRLVAQAFLPTDPDRQYVDHINAIRDDNRLENLRWVTQSENNLHAVEIGNIDREKMRENCKRMIEDRGIEWCSKPVIRSDGKRYLSASEAARDIGDRQSNVSAVARGERRVCRGYSFAYEDDEEGLARLERGDWKNKKTRARPLVRNDGKIFRTSSDAAKAIGASRGAVTKACIRGHMLHGFAFAYADDPNHEERLASIKP
jgi:hypothetical protein